MAWYWPNLDTPQSAETAVVARSEFAARTLTERAIRGTSKIWRGQ